MSEKKIRIGCFADDFTGASDICSFFKKGGLNTKLLNGTPASVREQEEDVQVIVIALKSRSLPVKQAVADSLTAYAYLSEIGCQQIYFKYCSTFDSTPQGNIGPVIDAVLEKYNIPYTILCPSLPVNGRTVMNGCLYVKGIPLHESPLKDHPLNPMWDFRIESLMKPQSRFDCLPISREDLDNGNMLNRIHSMQAVKGTAPFYIIPDYETDEDGESIASEVKDFPFITGGSGLAEFLAENIVKKNGPFRDDDHFAQSSPGKAIILAGSCSKATKEQISVYKAKGYQTLELNPAALINDECTLKEIINAIEDIDSTAILIHTSGNGSAEEGKDSGIDQKEVSNVLENTMARIATHASQSGYSRIITAGGETSGAIIKALGFNEYFIGDYVAPGVPVLIPSEVPGMRLVLKSGNFGQPDFFIRALDKTAT